MPKDSPAVSEPTVETLLEQADDERRPHAESSEGGHGSEAALALRNALKLGSSLILTWGVALIVAFKLPKYLGPTPYGTYQLGESWGLAGAVFLTLGVDTYISREIAVRPKHASDFFGGLLVARLFTLVPVVLFSIALLHSKVPEKQLSVTLFGIAYVFYAMNQTFQQMLQAASQVGGLAIANVASKVLWGGATLYLLFSKAPFWTLPLPTIASEGLKCLVLFNAARGAVDLELRIDTAATREVLKISFPFYIANVAVSLGSYIDVPLLEQIVASNDELGWYSGARRIALLSALLSPILSGVLVPMMSRAKHRNEEDFFAILRRGIEGVCVCAIPLTLMLALGAEFWIHITQGDAFLPAARSLRWLAPTFVFSYANVLLWVALMILDRSWTITVISIVGLVLLPTFTLIAVPLTKNMGPGGAGMGCAIAMSARELVICCVFLYFLGKRAVDRRAASNTAKSLVVCGIVIAADRLLTSLGPARLAIDAALYTVLAFAFRIVGPSDIIAVLKMIKDRKKPEPA
ncbi:MAG TPA: oligosaccharide flippase family protein [Labilithrix sp.]|nr:oligosaccharide flippase family protein [Labilithrix sp.]